MSLKVRKIAQPPPPDPNQAAPPVDAPPPSAPGAPGGPEAPGGPPPGGLGADGAPRPRTPLPSEGPVSPTDGLGGPDEGSTPQVTVDSATGEIHIDKGQVKVKVANDNLERARELGKSDYRHDNVGRTVFETREEEDAYYEGIALGEEEETFASETDYMSPADRNPGMAGRFGKQADRTSFDASRVSPESSNPNSAIWDETYGYGSYVPSYEDDPMMKDTHDNPLAGPKNRRKPPMFEVTVTAANDQEARALTYALQTTYALKVKQDGSKIVASDVTNPLAIMTEVGHYGMESEITDGPDLTKDFYPGLKVAILADFPDMNYLYDRDLPAIATVVAKQGDEYLLQHEEWGPFYAKEDEIGVP